MHVKIPAADTAEGVGIFLGENLAALQAAINAYIATLTPGDWQLWDADITAVGGGRLYCVTLTLQDAHLSVVPTDAAPFTFNVFLFGGEDAATLLADRAFRYANNAAIIAAHNVYVDKLAGVSNGRHYANLQIMGQKAVP